MHHEHVSIGGGDLEPWFMSSFLNVVAEMDTSQATGDALSPLHKLLESFPIGASEVSLIAAAGNTAASSAASASASVAADSPQIQRYSGWLSPLSNGLEEVLGFLQHGLDKLHIPYSYGFSIVLLTFIVRSATFPLTKRQVEVSMATQKLKPSIDRIKQRYGEDKERIQQETARLYELTKINPLAGCLPSLASIPIFFGLYYSLTNVANEGALDKQSFLWIPSLAGPTTLAARRAGAGIAWLYPFTDGHPPIGWHDAILYCIVPTLLVGMQYVSTALITPPPTEDKNKTKDQKQQEMISQALIKVLPLMLGWFSLNVPAGLGLYYFSNICIVTLQQVYLRKWGGADVSAFDLPEEKYGVSKRRLQMMDEKAPDVLLAPVSEENPDSSLVLVNEEEQDQSAQPTTALASSSLPAAAGIVDYDAIASRRCKRKRLVPAPGSLAAATAAATAAAAAAET